MTSVRFDCVKSAIWSTKAASAGVRTGWILAILGYPQFLLLFYSAFTLVSQAFGIAARAHLPRRLLTGARTRRPAVAPWQSAKRAFAEPICEIHPCPPWIAVGPASACHPAADR